MQTSWGSRPDGDANDTARLTPRPVRSMSMNTPRCGADLIRFRQAVKAQPDTAPRLRPDSALDWFPLDVKTRDLDMLINPGVVSLLSPAKTAPILPSLDSPWRELRSPAIAL